MRFARHLALALLAFSTSTGSARATPITSNYSFSVSGFSCSGVPQPVNCGAGAKPVDPVSGSFFVTFDNASTFNEATTGISLANFNINLGAAPGISYNSAGDFLRIGLLTVGQVVGGTNDFWLLITHASTNPAIGDLVYSQTGSTTTFFATTGTLTKSAVPEPATFSLLVLGLAGIAGHRWRTNHKRRLGR